MQRNIVGFRRDEVGDWIADLECGHSQHVRHNPPWQLREWVVSAEGRSSRLGTLVECRLCDSHPPLPDAFMILDHVQLAMPASRESEARAFFGDILGMSEEEKPEELELRGGCWFHLGTCVVHIGVDSEFRPQKKAHPAFVVEDLARLAQRLESSHFEVTWDRSIPGVERFYTADPFGNRIEFIKHGHGLSQR